MLVYQRVSYISLHWKDVGLTFHVSFLAKKKEGKGLISSGDLRPLVEASCHRPSFPVPVWHLQRWRKSSLDRCWWWRPSKALKKLGPSTWWGKGMAQRRRLAEMFMVKVGNVLISHHSELLFLWKLWLELYEWEFHCQTMTMDSFAT